MRISSSISSVVRKCTSGLLHIFQRTETGNAVDRNVAENLVARMQIMDIAGGDDRLVQLLADFADGPVSPVPAVPGC